MTANADPSLDEALNWAARIQDPDFQDWDAHAEWLSRHPGNPGRYHDAVLALEAGLDAVLAGPIDDRQSRAASSYHTLRLASHAAPRSGRPWRWASGIGMGIAACIAGLLFLPHASQPPEIMLHGLPGQAKSFHLPDGSVVALNGAAVLRFTNGERRVASLDHGEAFIQVAHDPGHVFELHAGTRIFRDIGTAFDVSRLDDRVKLVVTEGSVAFDPDGANIPVTAGRAILIHGTDVVTSDAPPGSVGTWRSGRLTFRNASLADVAHDLSLALDRPIALDKMLDRRRFSGVIPLGGDPAKVIDQLSRITGLHARPAGKGWLLFAGRNSSEEPRDLDAE